MELNPDFKEFFESLSKNEVRYLESTPFIRAKIGQFPEPSDR
jgi:hypothetical protein